MRRATLVSRAEPNLFIPAKTPELLSPPRPLLSTVLPSRCALRLFDFLARPVYRPQAWSAIRHELLLQRLRFPVRSTVFCFVSLFVSLFALR